MSENRILFHKKQIAGESRFPRQVFGDLKKKFPSIWKKVRLRVVTTHINPLRTSFVLNCSIEVGRQIRHGLFILEPQANIKRSVKSHCNILLSTFYVDQAFPPPPPPPPTLSMNLATLVICVCSTLCQIVRIEWLALVCLKARSIHGVGICCSSLSSRQRLLPAGSAGYPGDKNSNNWIPRAFRFFFVPSLPSYDTKRPQEATEERAVVHVYPWFESNCPLF